jgi:sarcosine oxidase
MNTFDVLVVGLGAHGTALVHELAQRGVSVLGIDSRTPPHGSGSTTGRTRITREAYYEHPLYVPLVQRAHELWAGIEELTGVVLLRPTGGLMVGDAAGPLITGTLASCTQHGLDHELLDSAAIRRRFPALLPPGGFVGVLEPNAGVLLVEPCMRTLALLAEGHGATVRYDTPVTSWQADARGVTVSTPAGELHARRAVFAAGPWLNTLLRMERTETPVQLPLHVERQTSHWYQPAPGVTNLRADACPITMLERSDGWLLYTLPDIGHGVKAGLHHGGAIVDPDAVDRTIGMGEERLLRALLEEWMPGAAQRELDATVCMYTNTPDHHFALGAHPAHGSITLVSACSGHGFKFAPALAELVADIVLDEDDAGVPPAFDVARLLMDQRVSSHG